MKYYKLTDELNQNEVVKEVEGKRYTYRFGAEEWVSSEIMTCYMCAEDCKYGQYIVITEDEVEKLLDEQRKLLNHLYKLAVQVATDAHNGQLDKGGNPYILHPTAVAESLDSTEHKIVAYLHDVCEDTEITFDDLAQMGFTPRIVNSIRNITKVKGVSYDDYLKSVKKDSNALYVKMADIKHNMDISRIKNPTQKDYDRIEKYKKALAYLEE